MERLMVTVGTHLVLALSVSLLGGYARQVSLGQAAFAMVGAWAVAHVGPEGGLAFARAGLLGLAVAAGLGLLLGLSLRYWSPYAFPILTLSAAVLLQHGLRPGSAVARFLGAPPSAEAEIRSLAELWPLVVVVGLCLGADRWFRRSRYGRTLWHGNTSSLANSACVIRATRVALVVSLAMAALAGALGAHYGVLRQPADFGLETSLWALAMAAWGGMGSLGRTVGGALLLSGLVVLVPAMASYRLLLSGGILLIAGWWHTCREQSPHGQRPFAFGPVCWRGWSLSCGASHEATGRRRP